MGKVESTGRGCCPLGVLTWLRGGDAVLLVRSRAFFGFESANGGFEVPPVDKTSKGKSNRRGEKKPPPPTPGDRTSSTSCARALEDVVVSVVGIPDGDVLA